MCGIAGIVDFDKPPQANATAIQAMRNALLHRGPDGNGIHFTNQAALAHTRLALLDVDGGSQPLVSSDGRYTIVYNGEIYNDEELKKELSSAWAFRTKCDTEVVLASFVNWGKDCLTRLNGMFAFFIWDNQTKTGFAARDRLGIKPFVYATNREQFIFASEAKAILRVLPSAPRAHLPSLLEYLTAPFFSGVEHSMFEEIKVLGAGCALSVSATGVHKWSWWDYNAIEFSKDSACDADRAAGELSNLLDRAVSRSVRTDMPLGIFFSGGLDSTLIASLAKRHLGSQMNAYTIAFEDQDGFNYDGTGIVTTNDTQYAIDAAGELGLTLNMVPVSHSDVEAALPLIAMHNDMLPAWEQEIAQHFLARAACQSSKAVLVGDAADETHFGYHFLLDPQATLTPANIIRRFAALPVPINREVLEDPLSHFEQKYMQLAVEAGYSWETQPKRTRATTYLIVKRWLARLLHNGDIHSMHSSLESRVPFGDTELIEFTRRLSPSLCYQRGVEKWLLRKAATGIIPHSVRTRKKSALPKDQAMQSSYQRQARQLLLEDASNLRSIANIDAILKVCDSQRKLDENEASLLFRTICLVHWLRQYGVQLP